MKRILLSICFTLPMIFYSCSYASIQKSSNNLPYENSVDAKRFTLLNDKICTSMYKHINNSCIYSKLTIPVLNTDDIKNLGTNTKGWGTSPRTDGSTPYYPKAISDLMSKYSAYYVGDTSKKVIYITFDEGYENGYSSKLLDILKENDVKAAFFVTTPYINSNSDLIKRMVAEGHLVCNHSTHHKSMPIFKDKSDFENELKGTEEAFEKVTGTKMPKFFRPPMGEYSELSLYYTAAMGYKSIFWSFAYVDFYKDKQPSEEYAKKTMLERTHNGAIYLLHAVSKTNTDVLDYVIKEWKNRGYEFKTLNDLP